MPALETMRVLDLTQWEAGPSCCQMLAWLGADVVKVEPKGGEVGRRVFSKGDEDCQYFLNHNANKRSVTLDLKSPKGRQLLLDLVKKFDVFVENQGPGVVEKLGLGPDEIRAVNPSIIYARIKGFGLSGPYSGYKSFDPLAMAAAGIYSLTGPKDGPPCPPGASFADTGTGMQTALAITAAYVQKLQTGEGQIIEMSMQDVMANYIRTMMAVQWGPDKEVAPRRGDAGWPPSGLYECKGGGLNDYAVILVANPRMYEALCDAIGRPDLKTDERFADGRARAKNGKALIAEVAKWTAERDKHEVMRVLGEAGVPVSATMDSRDVFADPHLKARGLFETVTHPALGEVLLMGPPQRMSASKVPLKPAPMAGEHTEEVLATELGLSADELATLINDGIAAGHQTPEAADA